MEKKDEELARQLVGQDPELEKLYEEHLELERQLAEMGRKVYLSPEKELEKKQLQKRKLAGKDQMMKILARYRSTSQGAGAA